MLQETDFLQTRLQTWACVSSPRGYAPDGVFYTDLETFFLLSQRWRSLWHLCFCFYSTPWWWYLGDFVPAFTAGILWCIFTMDILAACTGPRIHPQLTLEWWRARNLASATL